tara:strand:+ start:155 stop:367 length:213 start_codon:yes stop_codon:yes gene_type:complete
MTYPSLPNWKRNELALAADPTCEECDGSGVVDVTYNSDPTISRELACACVERHIPDDDDEAWSGGFAPNH